MNRIYFSKPSYNYGELVKRDIKEVAKEFEAVLIKQILKEAYRPILKNKSFYQKVSYDMLLENLSMQLAKAGGIGIAKFILEKYEKAEKTYEDNDLRKLVEDMIRSAGLPSWIRKIPEVESGYDPNAVSHKGAAGLWQLMPETARGLGLRVDEEVDERFDPVKSTRAALEYIKTLYERLKDWRLVLIAYNWGIGNLMRAGTENVLKDPSLLPEETRNYLNKILGMVKLSTLDDRY